jgi:hypothetical protein
MKLSLEIALGILLGNLSLAVILGVIQWLRARHQIEGALDEAVREALEKVHDVDNDEQTGHYL